MNLNNFTPREFLLAGNTLRTYVTNNHCKVFKFAHELELNDDILVMRDTRGRMACYRDSDDSLRDFIICTECGIYGYLDEWLKLGDKLFDCCKYELSEVMGGSDC